MDFFWGAEVKAGKPLKVKPDEDRLIHLSQVCLDNGKKGETAVLYVTVDGKKHMIGTLSQGNIPQMSLDLIFDKEFELSHSAERGSVHFIGYTSPNIDEEEDYSSSEDDSEDDDSEDDDSEDDDSEDDSEEEEEEVEVPATATANGNAGADASNVVKSDSEPKAKPAEVKKHESDDEDDEGCDEKGVSLCACFPGGSMLMRMIQMVLGTKKK